MSNSFQISIRHGSLVDFSYPPNLSRSAIVNAANQSCLGGGGVDGAISRAGGTHLMNDRAKIPLVPGQSNVRCPRGQARVTGPGDYGSLLVPYVIHAVGADYKLVKEQKEGDRILISSYVETMKLAEILELEAVAFPLLSCGVYRAWRSVEDIIHIGLSTLSKFKGYPQLKHVYIYAFGAGDFQILQKVAANLSRNLILNTMTFSVRAPTPNIAPKTSIKQLKPSDTAQLNIIEFYLKKVIQSKNSGNEKNMKSFVFPILAELASRDRMNEFYAVPGMQGGFEVILISASGKWKCLATSLSKQNGGSSTRQKCTITTDGIVF